MNSSDPIPEVALVLDTNVISNFARIGRMELLTAFGAALATTKEVVSEIEAGVRYGGANGDGLALALTTALQEIQRGMISVSSPETLESFAVYEELSEIGSLDKGEISAMVLASEIGAQVATDEKKAVAVCRTKGIPFLSEGTESRATVVILGGLLAQGIITEDEYAQIKEELAAKKFLF